MMASSIHRVLVVYKKSAFQIHVLERKDPHLIRLLRVRQPDVRDMRRGHAIHEAALDAVVGTLEDLRLRHDLVYRANLHTTARYDLIIAVGGDGTFLQAAHIAGRTPILGVNSDPSRSEAVFCAATGETIGRVLRRILSGKTKPLTLHRLQVRLNARVTAPLALNDVLIAHDNPATMSRYRLVIGGRREDQKSSGLWIAASAGSSSAIFAAGGARLPWSAKRFQYRPRELYHGRLHRYRLTGGVLAMGHTVELTWLMREGSVFIDGPHVRHRLQFGDRLSIGLSATQPLRVLGVRGPLADSRRKTQDS